MSEYAYKKERINMENKNHLEEEIKAKIQAEGIEATINSLLSQYEADGDPNIANAIEALLDRPEVNPAIRSGTQEKMKEIEEEIRREQIKEMRRQEQKKGRSR